MSITWKCKIIDKQVDESIEWRVEDPSALEKMLEHCRSAAPYDQTFDIDEREGYNGVKLFSSDESYTAFMGRLSCRINNKTELRTDLGRRLEKMVLLNAPEQYRKNAMAVLTVDFD